MSWSYDCVDITRFQGIQLLFCRLFNCEEIFIQQLPFEYSKHRYQQILWIFLPLTSRKINCPLFRLAIWSVTLLTIGPLYTLVKCLYICIDTCIQLTNRSIFTLAKVLVVHYWQSYFQLVLLYSIHSVMEMLTAQPLKQSCFAK